MSNGGADRPRPSRNEQREAAREKARVLREEQKKRERRNKWLIQGGVIVAVLAVAGLVAGLLLNSVRPDGPGPANMASNGIVLTGAEGVITAVETPGARRRRDADADRARRQRHRGEHRHLHRLPVPVLRPVRATNTESIRAMVEVGRRNARGAPHRHPDQQVGGHPVLAARRERRGLRGRQLARVVPRLPRRCMFENQPEEGTDGALERRDRRAREAGRRLVVLDDREVHRRRAVPRVGAGRHRTAPSPSRCRTPTSPRSPARRPCS